MSEVLDSFVEIEPLDENAFLKVKETLTRIGLASRKEGDKPILWQSCHVFHKRGRYYIVHFKQMFLLDGRLGSCITQEDLDRVTMVVEMLSNWGLVKPIKPLPTYDENTRVKVLPYAEKSKWDLRTKYNIGGDNRK